MKQLEPVHTSRQPESFLTPKNEKVMITSKKTGFVWFFPILLDFVAYDRSNSDVSNALLRLVI